MATYIMLMNLTDQGVKNIKKSNPCQRAGIKRFEAMGGKLIGLYAVMGEYDYIAIGEAPSDEVITTFAAALGSLGTVRTKTLRAFNHEEFAKMTRDLF